MLAGKSSPSLTRSEFAAVRAYVQGMPAAMVAARYLSHDADDDADSTESALHLLLALRDRMVQLAHQHGRQDLAVLLELGPGRSNRGMDRRVDALAALERLGPAQPRLGHAVELWFAPALARRLRQSSIASLKALCECANLRGAGWWRQVPRVGALAGDTVNRWLATHRAALQDGVEGGLRRHVVERGPMPPLVALAPDMTLLVPLERMARTDVRREENASGDPFAASVVQVDRWLAEATEDRAATRLAYRKEAERLLLWAAVVQAKPLSRLDEADCLAYLAFLSDPQPVARWCGPRAPRDSKAWRPFTGPLGATSRAHAVRVLGALSGWLARQGLSHGMNWRLPDSDSIKSEPNTDRERERAISDMELEPFVAWLARRGDEAHGVRYRAAEVATRLLRRCGLSLDALCSATPDALGIDLEAPWAASGPDWRPALLRHLADRGLRPDTPGVESLPLLAPPSAAPTPRAQRKRATALSAGYSPRGLHALLATMLQRYRESVDGDFPARTPRDLLLRRGRIGGVARD